MTSQRSGVVEQMKSEAGVLSDEVSEGFRDGVSSYRDLSLAARQVRERGSRDEVIAFIENVR